MVVSTIRSESLAPASGPYASGLKVSLTGAHLVLVSGQVAEAPGEVCVAKGDVTAQAEQVLRNLVTVLEAAGACTSDVVKVTVYLRNMEDREAVAEVRRRFFGDHLPASTLVEVSKLAHPDWLLEIEAMAVVSGEVHRPK